MSNKENARLLRQVARVIETEAQPTSTQSRIVSATLIQESDVKVFTQSVVSKTEELEKSGKVKVSIQYSTAIGASAAGQILIHSALLIGRT